MLNFIVGQQMSFSFDWFIEILAKKYGSFSPKVRGRKIIVKIRFLGMALMARPIFWRLP